MALSREALKSLAIELAAAMPPEPPQLMEVIATGEAFSKEALDIARVYEAGTNAQRNVMRALIESWRPTS